MSPEADEFLPGIGMVVSVLIAVHSTDDTMMSYFTWQDAKRKNQLQWGNWNCKIS